MMLMVMISRALCIVLFQTGTSDLHGVITAEVCTACEVEKRKIWDTAGCSHEAVHVTCDANVLTGGWCSQV